MATGTTNRIPSTLARCPPPQSPAEPWTHAVDETTAASARSLGDYFAEHALAVFERIGADPAFDGAHTVLDWITRQRITHFTKRTAHRALASRFQHATDLNAALRLLEEHGHIACLDEPHTGRGRPRSPTYWTHPRYHP